MNPLFAAAALAASTAFSPLAAHAHGMREFRPQATFVQPAVQPVYAQPVAVRTVGCGEHEGVRGDRDGDRGERGNFRGDRDGDRGGARWGAQDGRFARGGYGFEHGRRGGDDHDGRAQGRRW